jgi:protein SCO1/2
MSFTPGVVGHGGSRLKRRRTQIILSQLLKQWVKINACGAQQEAHLMKCNKKKTPSHLFSVVSALTAMLIVFGFSAPPQVQASAFGSMQTSVQQSRDMKTASITPHPGGHLPLTLTFLNSHGKTVRLKSYFHKGRPVIIDLINFQCWGVCGFVQAGLLHTMTKLSSRLGKDYEVVTVSFNPSDTVAMAADKKAGYIAEAPKKLKALIRKHWHFLVEPKHSTASAKLAAAIGFHYVWEQAIHMYDHEAAIYVITPSGKIANYFFGIHYVPADLKLALVHAGDNRITNIFDEIALLCTQFNPNTGKYTPVADRVMFLGGVAVVLGLTFFLGSMFWWERKHRRKTG